MAADSQVTNGAKKQFITAVNVERFVDGMRTALWQCAAVSLAFKGRVVRETKEKDSPVQVSASVSAIDRVSQEILLLRAHELEPGIQVVSEEMASAAPELAALFAHNRSRYVVVLDPMDGTDNYLKAGDSWAHMAGLLDQETQRLVAALVLFPERRRLYVAMRGRGATVQHGFRGAARALERKPAPRTYGAIKRLTPADARALEAAGFRVDASRNASSADDLVAVAEGAMGVSVMRSFHGHDSAIPGMLIEESGGALLGADGRPALFDARMDRIPLVVASSDRALADDAYRAVH